MLGLGETDEEILQTFKRFAGHRLQYGDFWTILQPTQRHLNVEGLSSEKFQHWQK